MSTIIEEMEKQSQDMGWHNFICNSCVSYGGNLICANNVFIAFTGANMANCRFYQKGIKCPHCGKSHLLGN